MICGNDIVDAHHVTFAQPKALGRKVGDQYAVPFCRNHHVDLHTCGVPERTWFALNGINALEWIENNWRQWENENDKRESLK